MSRAPAAVLAALLALAAALRFAGIGIPGLSSDEAFSWRLVSYPLAETLRRAVPDVHPPLYYLVLDAWVAASGESPAALRALSATLGVLAVAATFALVWESAGGPGGPRVTAGAAVAGALVALAPAQIAQGRNARMYALGILLAAIAGWLLLRALRRGGRGWWAAWGAAGALLVATHYFGVLTLLGQAVAALLPGERGDSPRGRIKGLVVGAAAGLVLFAAWIPFALRQARRVGEGYWIERPAAGRVLHDLSAWMTGLDLPLALALLAALATVVLLVRCARSAGVAGWALFAQAFTPWVVALAVSTLGPRPLYLARYMVFAQLALFALVGLGVAVSRSRPLLLLAGALLAANAAGAVLAVRAYPREPSALFQAARFLKRQADPASLVVTDSPRALNRLRVYALQADAPFRARAAMDAEPPLPPHYSHAVSLSPGDELTLAGAFAERGAVWRVRDGAGPAPPAPPGWALTFVRVFEGGDGSRVHVARYEPVR